MSTPECQDQIEMPPNPAPHDIVEDDDENSENQECPRNHSEKDKLEQQNLFANIELLSRYIPEVDPEHVRAQTMRVRMSKRSTMLKIQLGLATITSIVNICFTSWAIKVHPPSSRGIGTLSIGNCRTMSSINVLLHVALNILSSLSLGAANYCMQILVAPSRDEVDRSHTKGLAMDLGVLSIYNLRYIKRKRVMAWFGLGTIAAILHLLWNSAVFSSIPIVAYPRAFVTNDFKQANDDWKTSFVGRHNKVNKSSVYPLHTDSNGFTKLDTRACVERYIDPMQATSSLIVVASNYTATENNGSSLIDAYVGGGYNQGLWGNSADWICGAYHKWRDFKKWCTPDWASEFADHWILVGDTVHSPKVLVDHCLVGDQGNNKERCGIHYSAHILIIVCVCTVTEAIVVFSVWRSQRSIEAVGKQGTMRQTTMVTIGDAIANFLQEPDYGANHGTNTSRETSAQSGGVEVIEKTWPKDCHPRWFSAVRVQDWVVSLTFFTFGLAIPLVLLVYSLQRLKSRGISMSLPEIWQHGFKADGTTLANGALRFKGNSVFVMMRNVLFANGWQFMISFLYIFYNNILTRQLVADEFIRYIDTGIGSRNRAKHKKPLRVSSPIGLQRSSYALSLPFTYSIPLVSVFVLLHWLVSQSVFVVQTIVFGPGAHASRITAYDSTRIGYSPLGMILSIVSGAILVLVLVINSFARRYPNVPHEFPSMATSSAVIAAVCHRPEHDSDAHVFPVSLGVIRDRLTFSTYADLKPLEPGSRYFQPVIIYQESSAKQFFKRTKNNLNTWTYRSIKHIRLALGRKRT